MLYARLSVLPLIALSVQLGVAQTSFHPISRQIAEPRVPDDPLEFAADAQPVEDSEQRLAAINLLDRGHALSNVRGQPYDLKTTFTATGGTAEGTWSLEDISPSGAVYRWTAQGPSFSVVNLFTGGLLYSSQPAGGVPLRLAQVRAAIFFHTPMIGVRASVRTAAATLNGASLSCVLVEHMAAAKPSVGGRRWEEAEYCVDAKSGLLTTWSPAPGVYVLYDYSNAVNFHGKVIPSRFTIAEGGHTVVEARTESITDPAGLDSSLFEPSTLSQTGIGPLMTRAWNIGAATPTGAVSNAAPQAVEVHGMMTPGGELTETEIVASTDPALNQTALAQSSQWHGLEEVQPGATPASHEVFLTVQFTAPGPQGSVR